MANNQDKRTKTAQQREYEQLVGEVSPKSSVVLPVLRAFIVGGLICCLAQGISDMGKHFLNMDKQTAGTLASVVLIALTALLTAIGVFDKIGKFAGAGTFVPITGFANSITSAAMEFRREGLVMGLGAKLFTVAGPVIVWGVTASVLYGGICWLFQSIL